MQTCRPTTLPFCPEGDEAGDLTGDELRRGPGTLPRFIPRAELDRLAAA
ncbi:hypothetical protein [Streptomyces sp. HC307]